MTTHVALLTEGGADVGLGHVSRCLALARAVQAAGGRASLVVSADARVAELIAGASVRSIVHDWPADPPGALETVRGLGPDAVAVDSYRAGPELLAALRGVAGLVLAIDDTADRELPVDVVVNGGVGAEGLPYRRDTGALLLLGPRYALLDPAYADGPGPRPVARPPRALVTLGGGAHAALGLAVQAAHRALGEAATIDVAAGAYGAGATVADALAPADRGRVRVHQGRPGLRDLMLEADVAVTGAGMTLHELAATATPAVVVCMADNQRPNTAAFARAGAALVAGAAGEAGLGAAIEAGLRRLLADGRERLEVATRARALVDGRGAARVADRLLRPVAARR